MSESSASSRIKRLVNTYSGLVLMGAVGIPIGVIVGAICALFGRVLLAIGAFRNEHIVLLLPFLALMGLAIVFAYRTWGKGTDRGMSLVFDVGHGREKAISPRLVPLIMLSTWGTHLFGGSAGREGAAVRDARAWPCRSAQPSHIGSADACLSETPATRFCLLAWPPALPDSFERLSPPRSLPSKYWSQDAWNTVRCFPHSQPRSPQA